ncbi:IclR family transcriptional regulator [Conexibacter sp. JD483]|uniref:IclR family transcriptional regulator n=1 Tax=unclassified Conexibacter TaxID=2627773 RepID=UPI00271964C7|nr:MULTISPECIES: IclR family transcriptional regulator [unclassified Conexibacter]MDO8186245.1 IclR family transcriptional regulator [Conexibacter sp. CPCC 205706]MDO8199688.1 IclR family transcriptional regulator [Conexibacter sp. CPCC 205762]MDR9368220.1 IclR family transcriptional regulator [Conexibacter sp. JD483]
MTRAAGERYRVPAVMAAASILEAIARAPEGLTHTELVRELELSKSSAHNLLTTLESLGWVRRDPRGRAYRLGGGLVRLGAFAVRQVDALALAIERTHEVAGEHHLTVIAAQPLGRGDVETVQVAYPDDTHVGISLGVRYSWFDGAVGKVLLSLEPSDEAESLVRERARQIPAHTDRTLTDPDALLADIEHVRSVGYGASIGEYRHNNAVAVPVHDADGTLAAVLIAIGFPDQLTRDAIPSIGHTLRDVSEAITAECGGRTAEQQLQAQNAAATAAEEARR